MSRQQYLPDNNSWQGLAFTFITSNTHRDVDGGKQSIGNAHSSSTDGTLPVTVVDVDMSAKYWSVPAVVHTALVWPLASRVLTPEFLPVSARRTSSAAADVSDCGIGVESFGVCHVGAVSSRSRTWFQTKRFVGNSKQGFVQIAYA